MMHGREKSDPAIVADEADEQSRATGARSWWSQGRGPRGTRDSKARAGRRTGKACPRRWTAYGKPQGRGRRNGSPRSSTTSASTCSGWRSSRSSANAAPGVDGLTWQDYEADLEPKPRGSARPGPSGSVPGRCRPADGTYRRRTDGSGRWRSPPWRTRSSSGPRSRC